jgi:hypothetical protein
MAFFELPTKTLHLFLFPHLRATCSAYRILLDLIILIIFSKEYKLWSSSICCCLKPHIILSPLDPNIFLSTLFSDTLSQCFSFNVSSFTPIQNYVQNYILVYFNLHVVRQKGSELNGSEHYQIRSALNFVMNRYREINWYGRLLVSQNRLGPTYFELQIVPRCSPLLPVTLSIRRSVACPYEVCGKA